MDEPLRRGPVMRGQDPQQRTSEGALTPLDLAQGHHL
jgi:hypothetical protein